MEKKFTFGNILDLPFTYSKSEASLRELENSNEAKIIETVELTESHLPPEVLDTIFQKLRPQELKLAVQVCRHWREVGERPGLWTWGVVRVTQENMAAMPELLATRRLLLVTDLRVEVYEFMSSWTGSCWRP